MADAPRFPTPEEAKAERSPPPASMPEAPRPRPVLVNRAAPFSEDEASSAPKLTHDEVQALLAVHGTNTRTPARTLWARGRIAVLPTGLLSLAAHLFLGSAAEWVILAGVLIALAWMARPLLRRDGWS